MAGASGLMKHPEKPIVPEVLALIQVYYARPGNEAGGNLHVVLDDGNIKLKDVQWCFDRCMSQYDWAGARIMVMMLRMSRSQRRRLYLAAG